MMRPPLPWRSAILPLRLPMNLTGWVGRPAGGRKNLAGIASWGGSIRRSANWRKCPSLPRWFEMRLGIDAWGLSGDGLYSGVGQYASGLIRHLSSRFPTIKVIAYAGPGERRPGRLPGQADWRPVPALVRSRLSALSSRLLMLPRLARKDSLDLFHAPAVHIRPSLPPVPRLPCPVVVTLHDLIPLTYYDLGRLPRRQRIFYRWNLDRVFRANALITVSEQSAAEIAALREVPPQLSV